MFGLDSTKKFAFPHLFLGKPVRSDVLTVAMDAVRFEMNSQASINLNREDPDAELVREVSSAAFSGAMLRR